VFARAAREVLSHRRFVGYVLVSGSSMGAVFAYVATSAFVLQSMNGVSPSLYSDELESRGDHRQEGAGANASRPGHASAGLSVCLD
jgi:hypothetical protein